jgi:hypothetical protein
VLNRPTYLTTDPLLAGHDNVASATGVEIGEAALWFK